MEGSSSSAIPSSVPCQHIFCFICMANNGREIQSQSTQTWTSPAELSLQTTGLSNSSLSIFPQGTQGTLESWGFGDPDGSQDKVKGNPL